MILHREKVITFGSGSSLVGIVTEPPPGSSASARPAFILLNSGMLHRVGSCRLHVRLARALAARGFTSLRFDFSGVGDSDLRHDTRPFEESAVLEVREAMDYLTRTKRASSFVLLGLCSGADMSHTAALADDRVTGMVLIDGWVHRTIGHYVHHYAPRVLRLAAWRNSLRIRWQMLRGVYKDRFAPREAVDGVEYEAPAYARIFPPRARLASEFRRLVARRVAMFCLWTGGLPEYNHRGQFAAAYRGVKFGSLLREEHLPDADHIITNLQHQEYVIGAVTEWARNTFAANAATTANASTGAPAVARVSDPRGHALAV